MKYHVNPKTGRAGQCRATKKGCPLGADAPHFETKDDAQSFIEKESKERHYSFNSMSKKSNDDLETLNSLEESSDYSYPEDMVNEALSDYTTEGRIDEPDYRSSFLLEKDGKHYVVGLLGGDYHASVTPLGAYRVEPVKVEQYKAKIIENTNYNDGAINDSDLNKLVEETNNVSLGERTVWGRVEPIHLFEDGNFSPRSLPARIDYTREDGSKIIGFHIKAPGDRSFTDEPAPVHVPIELYENGERQNAREMQEAYVVYDTRTNKGFSVVYQSASDGYSSNDTIIFSEGKGLIPESDDSSWTIGNASISMIEGDGDKQFANHWKRV